MNEVTKMSELKMIAPAVKNVPWQEKPEDIVGAPIWRYTENPIMEEIRLKE